MAGYSGTPLPRKLGLREGSTLLVAGAPPGFAEALAPLPPGTRDAGDGEADVIVLFATEAAALVAAFDAHLTRLAPGGGLWVAWPKRSSGVPTDLTEDRLRELFLPTGLVDNKVCAIDETWSGLRFVRRRPGKGGSGKG